MNNWEFFDLLLSNTQIYLFCIAITVVLYSLLLKNKFISILDPFFISMIFSAMGFADVLLMQFTNKITLYYFTSYILTQIAIYLGFIFGCRLSLYSFSSQKKSQIKDYKLLLNILLFVSFIVFLICQLFVYSSSGIPLFMKSRLETFTGGSGFGLLSRFISVSKSVSFLTLLLVINHTKNITHLKKLLFSLMMLIFIVTAILSGSKSSFLVFASLFFCYTMINSKDNLFQKFRKQEGLFVITAIAVSMSISVIQQSGNLGQGILAFLNRFIFAGDVYWYSYPNSCIESLVNQKPLQALFTDFLGLTRLVPWKDLPTALGIDLYKMHHLTDTIQGPNARHNVFGYVYFGFSGSIIFSSILGIAIGIVRNLMINLKRYNMITSIFIILVYIEIFGLEIDPMLTLSNINSILIVLPSIYLITLIIYIGLIPYKQNKIIL